MNVNAFSMFSVSAFVGVAIEQLPHAFTSALPNGVRQRYRPCLAAEANGVAQTIDQRGAARTVEAMIDRLARGGRQLSIEVTRDVRQHFFAGLQRYAHGVSSCFRNISRARWSRVFTFASEMPVMAATSFVERPSISRMTTTIRYDGGRRFNA